MPRSAAKRRRRRRRERTLRRVFRLSALTVLILLVAVAAAVLLPWREVGRLAEERPQSTAFIEAWREQHGEPRWQWVDYPRISPELKRAVLVAEDIDFFSHRGFAVAEMRLALRETLEEGKRLRGASTISQQLAKNLWLSPSRNPMRKLEEALLTYRLERQLDKRRILELYLNVVEFGPGVFGAEAAARHYFGVSADALDRDQAAALAASLPHSRWYPGCGLTAYERHRQRIMARMAAAGWLERVI